MSSVQAAGEREVMERKFTAADWDRIELVIFDVDGTLYRQRPVRIAMAASLAWHGLRTRRVNDIRALASFRRSREQLSNNGEKGFDERLHQEVGTRCGLDPDEVRKLVGEWMERRPLRHLERAKVAGVDRLFDRLRHSGRKVAVWSDYPVPDKLQAMGLAADFTAAATDSHVACLKPDPAGLQHLMAVAGVKANATLMIGDRRERDCEAARRVSVSAIVRSRKACPRYTHFQRYDDSIFHPVLSA